MTIWVTWNVFSEQCVGEGRSRCIHINVGVGHREDSGFRRPTRVSLILNFNLDIYMLCLVSAGNVLDKENKGVYVLMSGLDIERVFISSGCVGWELIYDQFTVIVNWRYYPVFIFQLGQNSMDAHEKILWFWSESFNFTSRHEQESPVYDHVFNDLPLYVHVPLYLEKNPASTSLMLLAFEFP